MKKQYAVLMGLFFFIFISCDEYKESHDAAKTSTEFELARIEFRATQFKLEAYNKEKNEAERIVDQPRPYGPDPQSVEVLIYDACERRIDDLKESRKDQLLNLCKFATSEEQFKWLFKNKTDDLDMSIVSDKSMALVLLKNKYFEPDSAWINFMLESGAVNKMYGKK